MRVLLSYVMAAAIALFAASTTVQAKDNPIFGGAKVTTMSKADSEKVTGKGGASAYYGYIGAIYLSNAVYYAGIAQYYNYYNASGAGNYYYAAYANASNAATYYLAAYYNATS